MEDDLRFGAELTKINFLLENLYAMHLRDVGASHEDISDLSDEVCRQAGMPLGAVYGPDTDREALEALQELVQHRIATFFSRVRDRMRSAEEG